MARFRKSAQGRWLRARRHDGATNRAEKWAPLASSLSLALPVGLACETDRGKERERERREGGEGGRVGRVLRGKRPAKSGALLACVRACVLACVRALSFFPSSSLCWVGACGSCARLYICRGRPGWPRATGRGVRVVIQWPCELDYTLRSRVFHERADIRPFVTPWPAGRKHVA